MAVLQCATTRQRLMVPARAIIGRSRSCSLVLDDPCVSGEHAALTWTRHGWELHDLGSRNGTFVDGRRLNAGATLPIERGGTVAFGDPSKLWLMEEDLAPEACARDCSTHELTFAQDGILVLPEPRRPIITVFSDPSGVWIAEVGGEPRNVEDGTILTESGIAWQLHLPTQFETTQEFAPGRAFLGLLHVQFRIGADREFIELIASHNEEIVYRSSRAFNNLLLTLSRKRLDDANQPAMNRDDHGWMYVDEICNLLAIDENRLAVDVHRARREFATAGIMNAANIIERRRSTRQLRIGIPRLEIRDV